MGEIIRAAFCIFVCGDKALFVQRSAEGDHAGEWAFPGGKLEDGESAEEALRRECREEIGRMPKGTVTSHHRRISTVIPEAVVADASAPQVDATTFVCRVVEEFEPTLNDEHTGYAWAPLAGPPQPMHPGAAAAIAKFSMNEYDIAVEIMRGGLTSPQEFMGLWLFDMRITGTGMSFRSQHKEFVMRDPALYLNEEFLSRCNGLEVIVEHPPGQTLDPTTDDYRDRIVGSIMLPYIKGDEVWGIARIRDAACAAMLTDPNRKTEYSTSPTVVFRKGDGNTQHVIDGQKILVEGKPSLLDHLAICRVGVWDKGGEPNGIVSTRGDSDVADKTEDKKDDSTKKADADPMLAVMDSFKAMADSLRADMKDCMSKMDSFRSDMAKADAARADASKKADEAEDEKKDDAAKKADAKKADADEDDKKDDAAKKADATKKADGEDDMDKKDDARADAMQATIDSLRTQMTAMAERMPAIIADADKPKFATAQMRADVAFTAMGKSAPAPLMGETYLSYRKRMANDLKGHSKRAKDMDIMAIGDEATLNVIEDMVFADAVAASCDPTTVPLGQLRPRSKVDSTGMRKITEYDGNPASWMSQFGGRTFAAKINTERRH